MFLEIKFNLFSLVVGFIASYGAQLAYNKWGKKKPVIEVIKDKAGRIDYSGHIDPNILEFKVTYTKGILTYYTKPKIDATDTGNIS